VSRPAIFLDRDGTLSREVGYINHLSRYEVFPFTAGAVRAINAAGYLAVVATNQAAVARGYCAESLVHEVHGVLRAAVEQGGGRLDGVYVCLHHPSVGEPPYRQDCDCRKPKPGLLKRAASELDVDLARSWMIGDRYSDVRMAWSVGARGAMVRTGYGLGEIVNDGGGWARQPDVVADHVLAAVTRILADNPA
jgi:D-glycero-D-manno-heptose 1,7-bisphosphate phosphatase